MSEITIKNKVINIGAIDTSVTLDNVSRTVREQNLDRECLVVTNDSDQIMYLSLAGAASTSSAIRINSNGGSVIMGPNSSIPWMGPIYGIVNADSSAVATIMEF